MPAAEASDANVVKAAVARDGRALYFSRAPIPFRARGPAYRKHLGLYAYRAAMSSSSRPSPSPWSSVARALRWLEADTSGSAKPE
jgi:3-deoxy-manno-octulosonate cytidylyltransferase (CMP-KDO synthetase)